MRQANGRFGSRAALLTGYQAYDLHQEWVRPLSPGQLLQSRPRYIRVYKEWLFYNDGSQKPHLIRSMKFNYLRWL
jgi:hypothetical protein